MAASQKVQIPDEPSQKVNPMNLAKRSIFPMNPSQKVHIPDEP